MLQKRHLSRSFALAVVEPPAIAVVGIFLRVAERNDTHRLLMPVEDYAPASTLETGSGCAGAAGVADDGGTSADFLAFWSSSVLISSSSVFFSSLEARLNSAMLLPSDLPSSGSLR